MRSPFLSRRFSMTSPRRSRRSASASLPSERARSACRSRRSLIASPRRSRRSLMLSPRSSRRSLTASPRRSRRSLLRSPRLSSSASAGNEHRASRTPAAIQENNFMTCLRYCGCNRGNNAAGRPWLTAAGICIRDNGLQPAGPGPRRERGGDYACQNAASMESAPGASGRVRRRMWSRTSEMCPNSRHRRR